MNIVLLEPEIPQNTGNIARTCACTGSTLHLIEPMGFRIDEKRILRSGMDYWFKTDIRVYESLDAFLKTYPDAHILYATTKGQRSYSDYAFKPDDFVMFGKESAGIPEEILCEHHDDCLRIPMSANYRSLNLSNSVAIILYEALRQNGFAGLEDSGNLHRLEYK